ncbi:MAG: glycoside hydrolase family 3 C-terminal domain-containing protein [Clostridiales Family XIII bacterium]|nr:glycoside hydrolase family 3 C-terminal domain-containing protein [Clostridiales Family XIII bacterium]
MDRDDYGSDARTSAELDIEEKSSLCSGLDNWRTKPVHRLGIGSVCMADGPHGVRKETEAPDGKPHTEKSVCFPCLCLLACCFDTALAKEYGLVLGGVARAADIDMLLAPGVNLKRSPLCGRNFEYFSEDPVLTGELACAFVLGLQEAGVGSAVKHFALNNQEKARLSSDSIADERAKRELYLLPFEMVAKKAGPWAVVTAYNKVDGIYASENTGLIRRILREDWGYGGLVVSDWGGVHDRVKALHAGLDLEMPSSGGFRDREIKKAAMGSTEDLCALDEAARGILDLAAKSKKAKGAAYREYIEQEAHETARRIARESFVLLKNEENLLPLPPGRVAVVGAFACEPRYQGGGAANIHPTRLPSFLDVLAGRGVEFIFAKGYSAEDERPDDSLVSEAVSAAQAADSVLVFAGTPVSYESEGYDRAHMRLPEAQNRVISEVAKANPNAAAVLFAGGPIEMPWIDSVRAALFCYLPGQAGAEAAADCLWGSFSPCGKLPETFPVRLSDTPCHGCFGQERAVEYRESIFVGYRYYSSAGKEVLFPFGHGLSYSSFEYGDILSEIRPDGGVGLSFTVTNTGGMAAAEAAQVYISADRQAGGLQTIFRAERELKAFAKVSLAPGQTSRLHFSLTPRDFAFFNTEIGDWHTLGGSYRILAGSSSSDIRLDTYVELRDSHPGAGLPGLRLEAPEYYDMELLPSVTKESFEALLGRAVPAYPPKPFTRDSTLKELRPTFTGKLLDRMVKRQAMESNAGEQEGQDLSVMLLAQADYLPLDALIAATKGRISGDMLDGILDFLNGRRLGGLRRFIRAWRERE